MFYLCLKKPRKKVNVQHIRSPFGRITLSFMSVLFVGYLFRKQTSGVTSWFTAGAKTDLQSLNKTTTLQ